MQPTEIVLPEHIINYTSLVQKDKLPDAIKKNTKAFRKLLKNIPAKKIDYAYAPGKWTIKQLLQHIIDAERVFTYRSVWFARRDGSPLPGFDENNWGDHADVSGREWDDMVKEYKHVRKATELLFKSFTLDDLKATGTANNNLMNVGTVGYLCAGHVAHHMKIIRERYLG